MVLITSTLLLPPAQVMYFVDHQDERDSLQPVDLEELVEADRATTGPVLPKGPVIIIGAGPAGLAAAASLKRNGIQSIVLEARDRWARRTCRTCTGRLSCRLLC
jgi:threonine dehydrogenase-like Zn-dependent dehydrogenase